MLIILAATTMLTAGFAQAFQAVDVRSVEPAAGLYADISAENEFSGAETFINSVGQRGIAFLSDGNLSQEQRQAEFRSLLEESFDIDTIGRFALGRHWRECSPAQQKEYLKLFKEMIVGVYSKRFNDYRGQALKVDGARAEGVNDIIVTSFIVPDDNPEIQLDWRVRRSKKGGYKIIDVIVEGVSMALTQRSDFASVIQRGGGQVDVLLEHLKKS
ncbi:MAG: ABC transporter substrate-binding protein [Alphaproteobacteria bacterium]|nr:ABC transporter substrate-binding protein [Alphaproteobacteria bacterium]